MASTHETIVTVIRETANIVNPSGRFIYGDDIFQSMDYANNSEASSEEAKALISLFPFTYTLPKESETNYNTANLSMAFTRSADPSDEAIDVEAIKNEMTALAETFFFLLENASKPISYDINSVNIEATPRGIWMGYNTGALATFTFSSLKYCEPIVEVVYLRDIFDNLLRDTLNNTLIKR